MTGFPRVRQTGDGSTYRMHFYRRRPNYVAPEHRREGYAGPEEEWEETPFVSRTERNATEAVWIRTTDVVGNRYGDNVFISTQYRTRPISGSYRTRRLRQDVEGLVPFLPNIALTATSVSELTRYTGLLYARANPARSEVNIPLALYELRELPKAIKSVGDLLKSPSIKTAAGANLAYQFGWKPLIGDVLALFELPTHTARRHREILEGSYGRLKLRKGLGRRESNDLTTVARARGISQGFVYRGTATQRLWGTALYQLEQDSPFHASRGSALALSRRAVSGLYQNPRTLWDALPWSWLLDWYFNVGDLIDAYQATLHGNFTRCNIMESSEGILVPDEPPALWNDVKVYPIEVRQKLRFPFDGERYHAFKASAYDGLTLRKWGILASLAAKYLK